MLVFLDEDVFEDKFLISKSSISGNYNLVIMDWKKYPDDGMGDMLKIFVIVKGSWR